ncbi:MAG: MEDS domain-containing protein [Nitrospinae bacterium]|nr:MEDS domain-containing protein [Nitrospinota bacterium]
MIKTQTAVPMGFTGETFPAGTHMCLVYSDDAERLESIAKFLEAGILNNEKVGYFADAAPPDEIKKALLGHMSAGAARSDGAKLDVRTARDVYCPKGRFVPGEMLDTLRGFYDSAVEEGYGNARASGEMSWALKGIPGSDRLVEYEALINDLIVTHPLTPICQYNANLFDGATILNILKVHPMMIVHGQVVRNPYYQEPREFFKTYAGNTR